MKQNLNWLFSFEKDIAAFWGSIVFAYIFCAIDKSSGLIEGNLFFYLVCFVLIDCGHIFLTYFPISLAKNFNVNKIIFYSLPLIVLVATLLVSSLSIKLFITFLSVVGLFHILSQQYGWLAAYQKKSNNGMLIKVEKNLFWMVTVIPVFYWLNGYSNVPILFFSHNDLPKISLFSENIYFYSYFLCLILFVTVQAKLWFSISNQSIPKLIFLASHIIWLYYGLMSHLADPRFFRFASYILHGLSYFFLIQMKLKQSENSSSRRYFFNEPSFKIIAVASIAFIWTQFLPYKYLNSRFFEIILPLFYVPLLVHYAFDSIIWRSRMNKQVTKI